MAIYVVANPKGGVGKSTLATNLAGYLARREALAPAGADAGPTVLLGDVDPQGSSRLWRSLRGADLPAIGAWVDDLDDLDDVGKRPKGVRQVVLDTPAGLAGKDLNAVMRLADRVLVPLQPSVFDIHATRHFIDQLQQRRKHAAVPIALVGNRVREHTFAAEQLDQFLALLREQVDVPVLGSLRDTHNYLHLAAHGLSLWDVAPGRVARDLAQWQPLIDWVEAA
ncbi:MAG: ParA family protein [Leptothrix sp. (in: b-proteobacteria)]